jgi:hypothetical protein
VSLNRVSGQAEHIACRKLSSGLDSMTSSGLGMSPTFAHSRSRRSYVNTVVEWFARASSGGVFGSLLGFL